MEEKVKQKSDGFQGFCLEINRLENSEKY